MGKKKNNHSPEFDTLVARARPLAEGENFNIDLSTTLSFKLMWEYGDEAVIQDSKVVINDYHLDDYSDILGDLISTTDEYKTFTRRIEELVATIPDRPLNISEEDVLSHVYMSKAGYLKCNYRTCCCVAPPEADRRDGDGTLNGKIMEIGGTKYRLEKV